MPVMLPTAHIASALLVNRLARLDRGVAPAIFGGLTPDIIDKTLAWVLGLVPCPRHIGHTALAASLLTVGASAIFGRSKGTAFGAAYLVHLIGDLWHQGHVPWLMPFKRYDNRSQRWGLALSADAVLLEAIGAALLVLLTRAPADN